MKKSFPICLYGSKYFETTIERGNSYSCQMCDAEELDLSGRTYGFRRARWQQSKSRTAMHLYVTLLVYLAASPEFLDLEQEKT